MILIIYYKFTIMIEIKRIKEYPIKKCKNFGYTFCVVFSMIFLFFFFKNNNFIYPLFFISLFFLFFTIFFPAFFKLFAYLWEKFGIFLGKLFSPIILTIVYIVTILPINLILRILCIDLIKRKISKQCNSYWEKRSEDKVNFRNQF